MIPRTIENLLKKLARQYPVITVTGPRQSGKTTLCRAAFPKMPYVSLEAHDIRSFAMDDPRGFLAQYSGGAILDEIQRAPELPSYIQTLVDEDPAPGRFILTGSQQLEMTNVVSQSLAGRTTLLKLLPFSIDELGPRRLPKSLDEVLLTGFYPRIHDRGLDPVRTLADYFETYVERDLRQLAHLRDLSLFTRFVKLCAGRVGNLCNLQGLAADTGVSHTTARAWMRLLEACYVVFLLPPWYRNVSRRLIKSPKLYFYDVGLATHLLGIETPEQVSRDPLRGALFENLIVLECLKHRYHRGQRSNLTFFRDVKGNEIDLVIEEGREVFPIEVKSGATVPGDAGRGFESFERLAGPFPRGSAVVYGGDRPEKRTDRSFVPWRDLHDLLNGLSGTSGGNSP
ncbi:MAG TPA: ATP-binding protein [Candidatus Ozemobacteraceae bacterium]|nr:ATP-binding protein [Candidatus Ozemobacteraceae bacterium]HQG29567.1 ATP-binding protein [Candidatus Ozemobacteraceae bacterium]